LRVQHGEGYTRIIGYLKRVDFRGYKIVDAATDTPAIDSRERED
jgi:hypothetical protein